MRIKGIKSTTGFKNITNISSPLMGEDEGEGEKGDF